MMSIIMLAVFNAGFPRYQSVYFRAKYRGLLNANITNLRLIAEGVPNYSTPTYLFSTILTAPYMPASLPSTASLKSDCLLAWKAAGV